MELLLQLVLAVSSVATLSAITSKQLLTSCGDLRYHCFDAVFKIKCRFQVVRGVKSAEKVLIT